MKRTVFMSGLLGCGDGKRFVVRADEKLTAFLELEATTRRGGNGSNLGLQLTDLRRSTIIGAVDGPCTHQLFTKGTTPVTRTLGFSRKSSRGGRFSNSKTARPFGIYQTRCEGAGR